MTSGADGGGSTGAYLARIELRRRWRGVVLTGALVALVVGVVLTATAGARRSSSAFDRLLQANRPMDVFVGGQEGAPLPDLADLPHVEAVAPFELAAISPVGQPSGTFFPMVVEPGGLLLYEYGRPRVLEGRVPDRDEALAVALGERTARRLGVGVGDLLPMESYTSAGLEALFDGGSPDGPAFDLDVVGVVRDPTDVAGREDDLSFTVLTPAFRERFGTDEVGEIAIGALVALEDDPGAIAAFTAAADELGLEVDPSIGPSTARSQANPTMSAIALALLAVAVVVALTGAVVLTQILGRGAQQVALDDPTLAAIGCRRRDRVVRSAVPGAGAVVGGTIVGALLSIGASPFMPIGLARRAEPAPGVWLDGLVLGLGSALALTIGLVIVAATSAWWTTDRRRVRRVRRPGRLVTAVAEAGAPPPLVTGVAMALGRGSTTGSATRAGAAGVGFGVLGVVAALVFAASTDRLVGTPDLYGWGWDATISGEDLSNLGDGVSVGEALADEPGVTAFADVTFQVSVTVDGAPDFAMVIDSRKGSIEPVMLEGRPPSAPGEIALGPNSAASAGAGVGDTVAVASGASATAHLVTGIVILPVSPDGGSSGSGVVLTPDGAEAAGFSGSCDEEVSCYVNVAVDVAPGFDLVSLVDAQLGGDATVLLPTPPGEVERLIAVETLPVVLAGLLGLIATVTVAHAAIVTVRRRRRDLATLRVLGMTGSQVRWVVMSQVAVLSLLGGALGALLGVVVGRQVWQLVTGSIPLPSSPAVPVLAVVAVPLAMLAISELAASGPRQAAGRLSPAEILRAE